MKASLPFLANDLEFEVKNPTLHDSTKGSCLQLTIHFKRTLIDVFLFPNGHYSSSGVLPQELQSIVEGWLETVRSKKIEQENHRVRMHK